jgi:hypothetical protein
MFKLIEKIHPIQIKMPAVTKSWKQAAGLASKKRTALLVHAKKVRNEWDKK